MAFSDDFVASLRDDPVNGTLALCENTIAVVDVDDSQGRSEQNYDTLLEAYSLLVEVIDSKLLSMPLMYPEIGGTVREDCQKIFRYLVEVQKILATETAKLKVQSYRSRFRASLGSGFSYEFSQGDLDRVQNLLNQLRDLITNANQLETEHQRRLLQRLEKLQSEIHKKVSDLDRFWGLVGDAGVVLGKLGNDAKPIVDRIREIADIVWRTQSRAEELPSGTSLPSLEKTSTDDTQ